MAERSSEELPLVSTSLSGLPEHEKDYICRREMSRATRLHHVNRILTIVVALEGVIVLATALTLIAIGRSGSVAENIPFSPARDLLRNEIRVFSDGLKDLTVYQGNGTDAENAWEDLYLGTTMRLSREEALLLPNRTWPIENDSGHYIAQLDVFHELHCLNSIRRVMTGDHHPGFTPDHMSHCLDSIRQYIMCNIDVSVIVWNWDPEESAANPAFTHPHKCGNFEAIHRWARKNQMRPGFNKFVFVENDLPEPAIIH